MKKHTICLYPLGKELQVNDQISDKKRCRNIQMIHYRLMPNSHLFALIAKLRWESPFITGYHHVKYFAHVVMIPYRQFLSSAANEDFYNGCGNPYAC